MNREKFRELHSAIRSDARARALKHGAKLAPMPGRASLVLGGFAVAIAVERTARNGVSGGLPAKVYYPTICDRAPRQRIAAELAWAAHYRSEAKASGADRNRRAIMIRAARACIADARALQTAFAALPGAESGR